jgi:hypothetical protein
MTLLYECNPYSLTLYFLVGHWMSVEGGSKRQRHSKTHFTLIFKFDFDWSSNQFTLTTVFHYSQNKNFNIKHFSLHCVYGTAWRDGGKPGETDIRIAGNTSVIRSRYFSKTILLGCNSVCSYYHSKIEVSLLQHPFHTVTYECT